MSCFKCARFLLTISDINCTLESIDDPLFHLLEFYIHNDAPLTCRIPTHPLTFTQISSPSTTSSTTDDFIPLIFALSGALQLSHLHISPKLNVLLHTSPELATQDADILAATAYSSPSLSSASTRIVIGDPLALQFSVHWYTSPTLPPSTTGKAGLGGHVHLSTVVYCLLSGGVGVAASLAYFRGVELPRRIKRYGKDRMGGERGGGYAFPGTGMNGYGTGKRDWLLISKWEAAISWAFVSVYTPTVFLVRSCAPKDSKHDPSVPPFISSLHVLLRRCIYEWWTLHVAHQH